MHTLITGGAGFIGCNMAARYLQRGDVVTIFDNLSRPRTEHNLEWLRSLPHQNGSPLRFVQGDVRDAEAILQAITAAQPQLVVHLASQVAVTTSVKNPREDFEINALGTFNVLEAARAQATPPAVFFASTNKVYGGMEDVAVVQDTTRYRYRDLANGVSEHQPLDFHAPYGCSKGTGDQYVRDYARIYGMRTVVFRQSCLAADQTVVTPFGNKAISDLLPGEFVHSGQGWACVRHVWRTGQKPVRRLSTMNGLQVTLTGDHRIFRPHGMFSSRELAYGDFVAVLPEARYMPAWHPVEDKVLDRQTYLAAVQSRTSDARCLSQAQSIAERLLPLAGDQLLAIAEVAGQLFGDGHLGIHTRQSREVPAYTVQHFGTQQELDELSERLCWLGLPASSIVEGMARSELPDGQVIEGHTCRIQQQSIPIFTLFELLGVPVGDKVRLSYDLPQWVIHGHPLVKRAFLRGFFGAELCQPQPGSQNAPSFAQSKDVAYLDSGRSWILQLRELLAELGIETSTSEATPVEYKRGTTVQMTVRLLGGQDLYPRLAAIGYAFSPERSARLNAILRWQWTHTPREHTGRIEQLYRADGLLFWDSVECIEDIGEAPVFDLEIETDRHLVVAGGIQVSNCIYGERQFGVEDQGWVAHFVIAAAMNRPISIYGDGKQVRDLLYVQDLLNAYDAAWSHLDVASGQVFNVGGGMRNTLAIWWEFGPLLAELAGHPVVVRYGDWRPGDQPVFVSDNSKAKQVLGWEPQVSVKAGVRKLWDWVTANTKLFE